MSSLASRRTRRRLLALVVAGLLTPGPVAFAAGDDHAGHEQGKDLTACS